MNKKSTFLLLSASSLLCILLSGCGNGNGTPTKTSIQYGQLWDSSISDGNGHFYEHNVDSSPTTYTPYSKFQSLVNSGQSFIVVTLGSPTCGCWHNFRDNFLYRYMKAHNLRVYLMKHQVFDQEGIETYGLKYSASNEYIAVFNNGKLVDQHDDIEGTAFASKYSVFEEWMDARIKAPSMLYVTKSQLDALYEGSVDGQANAIEEFTIYFSRSTCGDCSYMDSHFLREYLERDVNYQTSYIFDCDVEGVRYLNGAGPNDSEGAKTQWNNFKMEYGLGYSESNPAGFDSGYVPTLYHVHAGNGKTGESAIDGGVVYFNDTVTDGVITSSYYTTERLNRVELEYLRYSDVATKVLVGANLLEEGETYSYALYHDKAAALHSPILEAFLNAYITL